MANIISDKQKQMTKKEMKDCLNKFLFRSALYFATEDGTIDYSIKENNIKDENFFLYFD